MIEDLTQALNEMALSEFFDYMLEKTGYMEMLKAEAEADEINRIDNVKEFKSILYQIEYNNLDQDLTQAEKIENHSWPF